MSKRIKVEVAYAKPDAQVIIPIELSPGADVQTAIETSGIQEKFPEIDASRNKMGIFGKQVKLDYTLREGDRVEIYRPLIADPKAVRQQRAEAGKAMKKGGGDL
ncbi:MAG: RnfH family protein [Betaproteobacteria bacterium]|jgi:putative ubiquitin-RnfH superfamily antitoxin RatB of RatAB toxin-antitoxin module|uniref:Persistence and stress-resistance antitoxin PasI n=1 Tax=mine drainage metagenome TaxID=410659 RepID=E6QT57_9ZZZZ|nr:RnfH family protein [Betaproteobacteria bacterium]